MKNFLSVGNVTQALRLDEHPLSLVLGSNSDANGGSTTRNGAGKTAILQALTFALYGHPLTKIKVDNLINNINQRGMVVTIDFEVDGKEYRIERGRKPNFLKFFVNGEEIEDMTLGENKETQLDISTIVGMSHRMFTHIVGINTYTLPFLKLPAKDQREIIEELLGVTQISNRAETLKKLIGENKEAIRQEEATIKAIQEANSRIERAIEQAKNQKTAWDISHTKMVEELARQIDELSGIDFEHEKKQFDALDAWNVHQRDLISKLDLVTRELDRVKTDKQRLETMIDNVGVVSTLSTTRLDNEIIRKRQERDGILALIPNTEAKIAAKITEIENPGDHTCVTCAQPLAGTDHLKTVVANLEKQLHRLEAELEKHNRAVQTCEDDIAVIEADIESMQKEAEKANADALKRRKESEAALVPIKAEIEKLTKQIGNIKDQMAQEDDKPATLFENRDEVYSTKHLLDSCILELERERAKANPHIQHLDSLTDTLQKVDFDAINRFQDLLRHQDFLFKLLTSKDSFIRKKIIEQNLYYLNTRIHYYLEKLGLPHEVVFQSDLSVDISLLGRDMDFEQLSRGESNRVVLAVSWSFRDVWESLNHSVNLVWCDEMIDNGTDGQGAEAAISIMKSMARDARKNVFLISHRDELVGRIENILTVSKDNGFTTISEGI